MPNDDHLPDDSQLPAARPAQTARRRRRLQLAVTLLSVAAVTAAGFALAAALREPAVLLPDAACRAR